MTKLIIFGNGQMARMMFRILKPHFDIVALTVDDHLIDDQTFFETPVVPFSRIVKAYPPKQHSMMIAAGFVRMNDIRAERYISAREMGYSFVSYVHPGVTQYDSIQTGENSIILEHVAIHPGTRIGNSVFISSNSNMGHDCLVEDNCWINAGVSLAGNVTVGRNSVIGINAAIGHGVTLGERTFVGANTLVTRDTSPGSVILSPNGEKHRLSSDNFLKFAEVV